MATPAGGPEVNADAKIVTSSTTQATHKISQMKLDGRLDSLRISSTDAQMYSAHIQSFSEFGLPESIYNAIVHIKKFERPSRIQGVAIPRIMDKKSLIGQSQAGSGKTTAFTVGMLLAVDPNLSAVQAICMTPTREICNQIVDEALLPLATFMPGLRIRLALKGEDLNSSPIIIPQGLTRESPATRANAQTITAEQVEAHRQDKSSGRRRQQRVVIHDHIVVGTPGKLNEWIESGSIPLGNVKILVLDEADQMIKEFNTDVLSLSSRLPDQCQRLLFSATFSDELKVQAQRLVSQGDRIYVPNKDELILDVVTQIYIDVSKYNPSTSGRTGGRFDVNTDNRLPILQDIFALLTINQSIVFCETVQSVNAISQRMNANNYSVSEFHARLETHERDASMARFKAGDSKVFITSNVLARGVDIPDVTCVVNFDLPYVYGTDHQPDYETYLHRVGRTGRFGKTGVAISFVTSPQDLDTLRKIETYYNLESGFIREWNPGSIDDLEDLLRQKRHDVGNSEEKKEEK